MTGGDVRLAGALVSLLVVAAVALTVVGVRVRRQVITAAIRAAVQLAVIGLVLRTVFTFPAAAGTVLLVMLGTASWTAARRLRGLPGAGRAVLTASLTGALPTLAVVFGTGAVVLSARYVVALGGIVLGGTMTACSLAGRNLLAGLRARRDEVEGWLALGATPRQAVVSIVRTSVGEALLPAIDQTRTVGLVTLPGAFVGALFGGASPLAAARFQLVVLGGLLAAETLAAVALTWLLGAPTQLPEAPGDPPQARDRGSTRRDRREDRHTGRISG